MSGPESRQIGSGQTRDGKSECRHSRNQRTKMNWNGGIKIRWPFYLLIQVVKQEMERVNVEFLGISELKCTGMGEFNSDDHDIYYCGQESLRRNGVAIMVNRRVWNAVLGCHLKKDRMICVHFQGKPFNITVIQVYASTNTAKKLKLKGSMKIYKTF